MKIYRADHLKWNNSGRVNPLFDVLTYTTSGQIGISVIARVISRPFGLRKNTPQFVKYSRVLHDIPRRKSIDFLPSGRKFRLLPPIPSGISWDFDPPTPLELPIPSVVGVWIFSGTTHCKWKALDICCALCLLRLIISFVPVSRQNVRSQTKKYSSNGYTVDFKRD